MPQTNGLGSSSLETQGHHSPFSGDPDTLGSDFCHQKSSDTAGHPAMGVPGAPVLQFPQIAV